MVMVVDGVIVIPLLQVLNAYYALLWRSEGKIGQLLQLCQPVAMRNSTKKRKTVLDFSRAAKS
jgi:hypothetical protein